MRGYTSSNPLEPGLTASSASVQSKKPWRSVDWDFTEAFATLEAEYRKTKKPIEVNFRELVPIHSGADRYTHLLHSYPAKLLANIPIFFLNCDQLRTRNGRVLDPFCGTGTVMLEAAISGHVGVGADANPLARLITRVKMRSLARDKILNALDEILRIAPDLHPEEFSPVLDVDRWFYPSVKIRLGKLRAAIRKVRPKPLREFFEVCFSNCIRKSSLADLRMSVPVRKKSNDRPANVYKLFKLCVHTNITRVTSLSSIKPEILRGTQIANDARELTVTISKKVDLVLTSPPYLGAQKYVRASSLSIGWLGLAPKNKLRRLEELSIGREHFRKSDYVQLDESELVFGAKGLLRRLFRQNPLRAQIAATYLREMKDALLEASALLKKGGHFVLVIGDNSVCGQPFRTSKFLRTLLLANGLRLRLELIDEIRSRGLMTKRNKTAGIISQEHIFVFQK